METSNFSPSSQQPNYDPLAVKPMRDELVAVGFKEMLTPEDVNKALSQESKTVLVVINSVCGCSAGTARPGAMRAVQHEVIPDELLTIFAGMEKDALAYYRRKYLANYFPSSPSMALLKNGEVVGILHRSDIEGHTAEDVAKELIQLFDRTCTQKGPSVSPEEFEKIVAGDYGCSTNLPKFQS